MRLENKKKDLPSHVARLHGLDVSRSTRIYKALSRLSIKAVEAALFNPLIDRLYVKRATDILVNISSSNCNMCFQN